FYSYYIYILILLKKNAGLPYVFYVDLYGLLNKEFLGYYSPLRYSGNIILKLILIRRMYTYSEEISYINNPSYIGFIRSGALSQSTSAGLVVIINNS
ncbi:hypothetical protein DL95DRAFT_318022, partial [Leptodontidium sp. 2 PMI_412]